MTTEVLADHHHDHDAEVRSKVIFGFWVYLLTDAIVFAALFATYAVMHNNTYGGPGIAQIASLPYVFAQTCVLLLSSLVSGFMLSAMQKGNRAKIFLRFAVMFVLGLLFLGFQYNQFANLVHSGNTWQTSAFLSIFFTMLTMHSLHVIIGLIWIVIVAIQLGMENLTPMMRNRFTCLGLFWNYVNIVWIFIFTIVYLMGAI